MDFDGNIWFTYAHTSTETTIARIDAKTGAVKNFKLDDQRGIAAGTHGITRDENGMMWFNTRSNVHAHAAAGWPKIDPKTRRSRSIFRRADVGNGRHLGCRPATATSG